ncbi:hypothetical protein SLNSH_11030 [Alsobacter soli]|uniref:Lipoprotein n=1 Tax=Alsobacter soli TaxID=2109933 RepID=A0A2T1HTI9_9HYPH|nr:lipoprotein [Alsobacter soli]PSC04972.1 hypothetical protein SLNSH_11030 [Alsobacter soli]
MPFPVLSPSRALALGLSAVLLVSLGACGRKGPLEPPPGAVAAKPDPLAQPEDDPNAARTIAPSISPVASGSQKAKGKPIKAPKEPFILDPIL